MFVHTNEITKHPDEFWMFSDYFFGKIPRAPKGYNKTFIRFSVRCEDSSQLISNNFHNRNSTEFEDWGSFYRIHIPGGHFSGSIFPESILPHDHFSGINFTVEPFFRNQFYRMTFFLESIFESQLLLP